MSPVSKSNIEWTDATWSPVTGCTKVSNGCKHCYAETLTKRYAGRPGWPAEFKPWTPANAAENVVLHPDRLEAPFSWRTPRRVFVNSMSDLFHEEIPDDFIWDVFAVMALTPQHTYQVLTKRPERMHEFFRNWEPLRSGSIGGGLAVQRILKTPTASPVTFPLPNVWLGVTVENQRWADERIPILLDTPAAVRFVSAEPLLGPLKLGNYVGCLGQREESPNIPWLDWIIVGGESGPGHRPFDPAWARSIVAQCADAGVAVFIKQMGGNRPARRREVALRATSPGSGEGKQ